MEKDERQIRIEPSRGDDDWDEVLESFIRSFYHYPLYTFLIPNESTRNEFLREYLKAIYDVTVRKGNSILLCVCMYEGKPSKQIDKKSRTVIGGVLFVPASEKGGWACEKDEDFTASYKKYRLHELDKEAMERIEKYEEWEYENITKKVIETKIPMWNGLFCAIDPSYAGKGYGTLGYSDCIKFLQQKEMGKNVKSNQRHWRQYIFQALRIKKNSRRSIEAINISDSNSNTLSLRSKTTSPTLLSLSHSARAANFHKRNGFHPTGRIAYNPFDDLQPPFNVHILVMNSFDSSKVEKIAVTLTEISTKQEKENPTTTVQ